MIFCSFHCQNAYFEFLENYGWQQRLQIFRNIVVRERLRLSRKCSSFFKKNYCGSVDILTLAANYKNYF